MPSATQYEPKPLPFKKSLTGISDKAMAIHHDKLYVGYVNKLKEVSAKLMEMSASGVGLAEANQTYSELRALRDGETFAANGVYLHEYYFNVLGGEGKPTGALVDALLEKYGSSRSSSIFSPQPAWRCAAGSSSPGIPTWAV